MIYRSGDLSSITDKDIAVLGNIGLIRIIDFRSERERMKRPNRLIPSVREILHISINDSSREKAVEYIARNDAAALEDLLINDYRELAFSPHLPVVFHCAAGKDRTGLAAVFLLTALGVDFDSVFDDYIASVMHNAALTAKLIHKINARGHNGETIRPLLEVKKEYLDAALAEIRENQGDLYGFVVNNLQADIARLQERFLEPSTSPR
jgi:protein-tyrosine phosphatase